MLKLTDSIVKSFEVAKIFENDSSLKCIAFSPNGDHLITCSQKNDLYLYDCLAGNDLPNFYITLKKHGADHIKFLHTSKEAIHASIKSDGIRLLILERRSYLRYFFGHTKKVTSLSVNPVEDTFASVSIDQTMKLWDPRIANHFSSTALSGSELEPRVAIDSNGRVIAVVLNSQRLEFYDIRNMDKGPKLSSLINQSGLITDIKFSKDNKNVLLSTNGPIISVINTSTGSLTHSLSGFTNKSQVQIEASFSSDDKYVFSGSDDGTIHCWSLEKGQKLGVLNGEHTSAAQCVKFNPKYMMLASSSSTLAFWLPS